MGLPPATAIRPTSQTPAQIRRARELRQQRERKRADAAKFQPTGCLARLCSPPRYLRIRRLIYWSLEEPDASLESGYVTVSAAALIISMIVLSLTMFVVETMPEFNNCRSDDEPCRNSPFYEVEVLTTGIFTAEYLLRFWVCDVYGQSAIDWALRPMNLCDLLSILPVYLEALESVSTLKFLRVLRVIRLFKLGRYSQGVRIMSAALLNSLPALSILMFMFVVGTIIFGSLVYYIEKMSCPVFESSSEGLAAFAEYNTACLYGNSSETCCWFRCWGLTADATASLGLCKYDYVEVAEISFGRRLAESEWEVEPVHEADFKSVLTAMWWASVTMTTVGYGDLVPKHPISKMISCMTMVSGLLIIAMPFAIVGAKFGQAAAAVEDPDAQRLWSSFEEDEHKDHHHHSIDKQLFEALQADVNESIRLKKKIQELQVLRSNLWTSAEHALASLTLEGFLSLSNDMLEEPDVDMSLLGRQSTKRIVNSQNTSSKSLRSDTKPLVEVEESKFCDRSCYVFHRDSLLRRWAIRITESAIFDNLVIFAIVTNSVILGMQDYYPRRSEPWSNKVQNNTEIVFIFFFTFECAAKIVAQGFILDTKSYLRDAWNWIDFIVVVTGIIGTFLDGTGLAFIRTIRVLRPLRTLSAMPGLRNLVNTIFCSLPGLKDVVLMALFLMVTFGILGIHFWGGTLYRRCRITPEPLHFTAYAQEAGCVGVCLDATANAAVFDAFCRPYTKCLEAYEQGSDFYLWPIDETQGVRFCHEYACRERSEADVAIWAETFGTAGLNATSFRQQVLVPLGLPAEPGAAVPTLCGSSIDDDLMYAPRIRNPALAGLNLDSWEDEIFVEDFNWGFTTYDNIVKAFFVVFQCVTLEGWVDVMYMLQDASSTFMGFLYFGLLVFIGSFFLLNIVLAIVWDAFMDVHNASQAPLELEEEEQSEKAEHAEHAESERARSPIDEIRVLQGTGNITDMLRSTTETTRLTVQDSLTMLITRKGPDPEAVLLEPHDWRLVRWARFVASNEYFKGFVTLIITMNVVVLSMDRFPQPLAPVSVVSAIGHVFNAIFIFEFVLLHVALLPVKYWSDNAVAFDGMIVVLSIFDIASTLASSSSGGSSSSGVTAMRAFRLLRIFKLANKFQNMKVLLKASIGTFMGMGNFAVLLFLIICVFALIGQSIMGGKFLFDPDTGEVIPTSPLEEFERRCPFGEGGKPVCVPRAHFDTFWWAFITIFQILTGENWNTVMYDGMKAGGYYMFIYFWFVMIFGQFVILNLFLALLMMNFEEQQDQILKVEQQKLAEKERVRRAQMRQNSFTNAVSSLLSRKDEFRKMQQNGTAVTSAQSEDSAAQQQVAPAASSSGLSDERGGRGLTRVRSKEQNQTVELPGSLNEAGSQRPSNVSSAPSLEQIHNADVLEMDAPHKTNKASSGSAPAWDGSSKETAADPRPAAERSLLHKTTNHSLVVEEIGMDGDEDQCAPPPAQAPSRPSEEPRLLQPPSSPSKEPAPVLLEPPPVPTMQSMCHEGSESLSKVSSVPLEDHSRQVSKEHSRQVSKEPAPSVRSSKSGRSVRSMVSHISVKSMTRATMMFLSFVTQDASFAANAPRPEGEGEDADEAEQGGEVKVAPTFFQLLPERIQGSTVIQDLFKRSLCVFQDSSLLRSKCTQLINHPLFDQFIILLISISSVLMMFQNPLNNPDGFVEVSLFRSNIFFTIVFTFEMIVKIIAYGAFCGQPQRPAYFQSSWNLLDAFIVTVSLIDVLDTLLNAGTSPLSFMKIFRIARVLRPLRLISRNENLKVVVKTISASMSQLKILGAFSIFFLIIFALLGVSMFKGTFFWCQNADLEYHEFELTSGVTPMCIPPAGGDLMQFADPRPSSGSCTAGWEAWQRPTEDTPICEVHCSGEHAMSHEYCQNTTPWGYHVMRCSDCRDTFCGAAAAEFVEGCISDCQAHAYFCVEAGQANHSLCLEQCEAECQCRDSCVGLVWDAARCVEHKDSEGQRGRWIRMNQHFDNLWEGMISLFEICTTEGWIGLMLASVDSTEPYHNPKRDHNEVVGCMMFVGFILLGTFFVLNLCVGVIIDNYNKLKSVSGHLLVTEAQSQWLSSQKALFVKKRFFMQTNLRALSPTRQHLIQIVTTTAFESFIMLCIIMNTVILGMTTYPRPSDRYNALLDSMSMVFNIVFNIEAAMKLCAWQLGYFGDNWNLFDLTCVVVGDAFLVVEAVMGDDAVALGTVVSAIRIFRIARLFRLVRFLKGLNQLFFAFVLSIPKLVNVAFIMMLLVYLYAVLGVNLFAKVTYSAGGAYNENASFRTFPKAMSTLIRSMTGEGWNEIMHDLSKSKFALQSYMDITCVDSLDLTGFDAKDLYFWDDPTWDPNECGTPLAFVFFITYTVFVTFVILNLFIAVIFEGFEESEKSDIADVIQRCVDTWKRYDPDQTMEIPLDRVFEYIDESVETLCTHFGKINPELEPRWDSGFEGCDAQDSLLPLYAFRHVRMLDLSVTPERSVRLVVAIRAVIRCMICYGGANSEVVVAHERLLRLKDLEAMDSCLAADRPERLEKELVKLHKLERSQARALRLNSQLGALPAFCYRRQRRTSVEETEAETRLVEEVAAAKIQLRFKESKQRKEHKALEDGHAAAVHAPNARLAG